VRISEVCIERPVLATVMSLVILLFGLICLQRLPNRDLPDVDPPVVSVTTVYPGAAPEVVETSVTQALEDQIIGIEGVRHVTSLSREQVSQISVEFELHRDIEAAANDVRDRVARARRDLPEEVEEPVVAKRDADARPIMWLAMAGEQTTQIHLSTIADTRVRDRLGKLPGVATVLIGGERRYSMRLWIDNDRLTAHGLTIADVADGLRRENVDLPSGRVESIDVEYTVRSLGELRTVPDYESLIVATVGGEPVRLRDLARVEVGPEDERKLVRFNGVPALGLGVIKQSKANTLAVTSRVRAELERLNQELPPGVRIHIAFDASDYIRRSIRDVTLTIFEAVVLVVFVIYLFLRTARATLIPATAIPISIIGTFAILYFTGFTINTLTLMGLTLAIGLVVDDAIVVLENITRWVEQGTPALEAARRGMKEISFAVVSATISAVAVFLPLTFLQDTTGRLFREFAVTVAAALLISGFVALTLSPALCALALRRRRSEGSLKALLARAFDLLADGYGRWLRRVLNRPVLVMGVTFLWVGLGFFLYRALDEELIPTADRGTVLTITRAPEGSTIEYTDRYHREAEQVAMSDPDVARVFSVVALGIGTPGLVNEGFLWLSLLPRDERERSQKQVVEDLRPRLAAIPGIRAFPFEPSPLRGFRSTPVSMVIQGPDIRELARLSEEVVARLEERPGFVNVRTDLFLNKPQLEVSIDRERASDLGVSVRDIASTLQILLGGMDISTFKLGGETYDVIAQLPRPSRSYRPLRTRKGGASGLAELRRLGPRDDRPTRPSSLRSLAVGLHIRRPGRTLPGHGARADSRHRGRGDSGGERVPIYVLGRVGALLRGGQRARVRLWARNPGGVSRSRRAVRELRRSADHPRCGGAVLHRCAPRALPGGKGLGPDPGYPQPVQQDRPRHVGGPRDQELHPDRRVRQPAAFSRARPLGGDLPGFPYALSPDSHDGRRDDGGNPAHRSRLGRRGGGPRAARRGRRRRDVLFDAADLLHRSGHVRNGGTPARDARCARARRRGRELRSRRRSMTGGAPWIRSKPRCWDWSRARPSSFPYRAPGIS
jgi:multidrug efflux pump